jgi:DNA adenine methylase
VGKIKGKFLLSLNDCPEVRQIFASFRIQTVGTRYSCMPEPGFRGSRNQELLIRNY